MTVSVFGADFAVTTLNRAFTGNSPSYAVFMGQRAAAGTTDESWYAFANTYAQQFQGLSDAALASTVLTNLGILPSADQDDLDLLVALTDYFGAAGVANRGIVVLQLSSILSNLENETGELAVYADSAAKWNKQVTASFEYSANPTNTTQHTGEFSDTPNNQGQTFTLTTGVDAIVGTTGNDTINGVVSATTGESTMTLADTINGGQGVDTFNLTAAGASVMAASSITGVEVFNIKNLAGVVSAHDFSGVVGEEQVWNRASTANVVVTGVDAVAIGVANTTTNMTVTAKASTFGAASNVAIALDGAGSKTQDSTITVGQDGAAGAATTVSIAAAGANYIALDAGTNAASGVDGIKTLTVTGTGTVTVANASDLDNDATNTFGGTLTKIDASANSGGLTIQVANKDVAVTGGSGVDVITLANAATLTDKAAILLGAGNDSLLSNASVGVGTKAVLDGGDGKDTISSILLEVANQANIKNWEVLDLKGETRTIDASLFTASAFESLALTGNLGGATTVQKLAGTELKLDLIANGAAAYGTLTATLAGAATGTADSGVITFANKAVTNVADSVTFTTSGLETISIASGGVATAGGAANTVTNLEDKANSLTSITVTGAKDFVLTDVDVNSAEVAAAAKTTAAALTTIDASAATGKVTITAGADDMVGNVTTTYTGLTIKAGTGGSVINNAAKNGVVVGNSGDDTITVSGSGATVDTGAAKTATGDIVNVNGASASLTLGTGLQTVKVQAGAAVGATLDKMTSITGAAKGDIIDFTAIFTTAASVDAITNVTTNIGTAASLTEALDLAAAVGGNEAAGSVVYFNWVDGNTYLVGEKVGAADGLDAVDAVVKLVGNYTSFAATDGVVTLA